ncbi:MAG TPA: ABC transporter permease [Blastocatellia bacterium]|jgi:putative ABC transport system permease protein|nr:ABC transporter permease [Blastocatellia bacterium]
MNNLLGDLRFGVRILITSGVRLLAGRDFDERDSAAGTQVIIINQTFARRGFGDDDPLGKRIKSWRDENKLREVVGVVVDVRYDGREEELPGLVYVPYAQDTWRSMALNVRTRGDAAAAIDSIRSQIKSVDKDLVVADVKTMTSILDRSSAPRRLSTVLLTGFAVICRACGAGHLRGVVLWSCTALARNRRADGAGRACRRRLPSCSRTGDEAGDRAAALGARPDGYQIRRPQSQRSDG